MNSGSCRFNSCCWKRVHNKKYQTKQKRTKNDIVVPPQLKKIDKQKILLPTTPKLKMFGSLNENLKFFNFWQLNCRMISNRILHCSVKMYGFQHDIKIKKCDEDDPVSLAFVWYKSQNFPQPESIAVSLYFICWFLWYF